MTDEQAGRALDVEISDYACGGHVEIWVDSAPPESETFKFDMCELRHVAGNLARLAIALTDEVRAEAREHSCGGECTLNTSAVADPYVDASQDGYPAVFVTVPIKRREYWLTRINDWLDIILGETA